MTPRTRCTERVRRRGKSRKSRKHGQYRPRNLYRLPPTEDLLRRTANQLAIKIRRRSPRTRGRTLSDEPAVARLFPPELNVGIHPREIALTSAIRVTWCCCAVPGERHLWIAPPGNVSRSILKGELGHTARTKHAQDLLARGITPTRGCPGCSGTMATPTNNLLLYFPEVVKFWDYSRNGIYRPEMFTPRSSEKPWWIDPKSGRRTRAQIVSRTQSNRIGTNRIDCGLAASETNNLQAKYPKLAKRVIGDENGAPISPKDLSPKSNRTVQWRCAADPRHTYFSAVYTVVGAHLKHCRTDGCPFCRGVKASEGARLCDLYPELAMEWNASKRNQIDAREVNPRTSKKGWFKCEQCGYIWRTRISQRTLQKQGCPACKGRVVTTSNCLAATHPELLAEWHHKRNGVLTPSQVTHGMARAVWWRCKVNDKHLYRAAICSRTRPNGRATDCPHCSPHISRLQVRLFNALRALIPDLVYMEVGKSPPECSVSGWPQPFDAALPTGRLMIEYDGHHWHKDPKHTKRSQRKERCAAQAGFSVIRIREALRPLGPYDIEVPRNFKLAAELKRIANAILFAARQNNPTSRPSRPLRRCRRDCSSKGGYEVVPTRRTS